MKAQREIEEEETITDANAFNEKINKEQKNINNELFKKDFKIQGPSDIFKLLSVQTNDKEKNNELVSMINSGLKDLKEEIEKMSNEEKEIEDPESIVEIVKGILKFNKQKSSIKGRK